MITLAGSLAVRIRRTRRVALAVAVVAWLAGDVYAGEAEYRATEWPITVELRVYPSEHGFRVGERACAVLRVISCADRALWHTAIDNDRALPAYVGVESSTYTEGNVGSLTAQRPPQWRGFELHAYKALEYCETFELREPGKLMVHANLQAVRPPDDLRYKLSNADLWTGKLCVKREITVSAERSAEYVERIATDLARYCRRAELSASDGGFPPSGHADYFMELGFGALPEMLALHSTSSSWQEGDRAAIMLAIGQLAHRAYSEPVLRRALEVARTKSASPKERSAALLAFGVLKRHSGVVVPQAMKDAIVQCLEQISTDENPEVRGQAEGHLKSLRPP